jgi:hypothetical protein
MEKSNVNKRNLTKKQELFCKLFATNREYFGNGTQAYAKAYNIELSQRGKMGIAKASASRLLTYDYISDYINKLIDIGGLNDKRVDKELLFLIEQNANFNVKLGAIKEYNSLRKRIIQREEIKVKSEWNISDYLKELKNKTTDELIKLDQEYAEENMRNNAHR